MYMPMKDTERYDMRIGERLYAFPDFNEGCKAIAIHCRFIGNQNDLEILMKERGIIFTPSDIETSH